MSQLVALCIKDAGTRSKNLTFISENFILPLERPRTPRWKLNHSGSRPRYIMFALTAKRKGRSVGKHKEKHFLILYPLFFPFHIYPKLCAVCHTFSCFPPLSFLLFAQFPREERNPIGTGKNQVESSSREKKSEGGPAALSGRSHVEQRK